MRLQNRFDVNNVLLVALLIIPLSFSPFISYDPFNTAKFISLSIFGILSLIIILINRGELWGKNYKLTTNLSLAFIIWCICSWVFSGHNLIDGLFGVPSRNYGVLSNIFLQLIFLIAIFVVIEWLGRENQYAIADLATKWNKPIRWAIYYAIIFIFFINNAWC